MLGKKTDFKEVRVDYVARRLISLNLSESGGK